MGEEGKRREVPAPRRRADMLLFERGLFESRAKAQAAIAEGLVTADGEPVRRASELVGADAVLSAQAAHPWVSRGGVKLKAALENFEIDPSGRVCLDLGSSTGGFTQVLLAGGARRVYAVDVGRGQLHARVAADPRVVSLEGTDARVLGRESIPEVIDLLVCDVSFISLKLVLPAAVGLLNRPARLALLVKPQFEAGRAQLRKGMVRDADVRRAVCDDIAAFVRSLDLAVDGVIPSPIAGGDGNREFLLGARHG